MHINHTHACLLIGENSATCSTLLIGANFVVPIRAGNSVDVLW